MMFVYRSPNRLLKLEGVEERKKSAAKESQENAK